jgi:hypothetical protein
MIRGVRAVKPERYRGTARSSTRAHGQTLELNSLPAGAAHEVRLMSTDPNNMAVTDLLLASMFLARRVVLWAAGICAISLVAMEVEKRIFGILTERSQFLLVIPYWISLVVAALGLLVTFCFVFLAPLREMGLKYAISHLILCVLLSLVGLLGIILVPLLISWEIERVRATGDQSTDDTGYLGT